MTRSEYFPDLLQGSESPSQVLGVQAEYLLGLFWQRWRQSISFKGHESILNFFNKAYDMGIPYFLYGLWLYFPLRCFSVWIS